MEFFGYNFPELPMSITPGGLPIWKILSIYLSEVYLQKSCVTKVSQVQEPPAQRMKLATTTNGTEAKKPARAVILFFFSQLVPYDVRLLLSDGLCLHRGVCTCRF